MIARLTFYPADKPVRQFLLDENRNYLVGRDESCAMAFDESGLSRRHARIYFRHGDWQLADLCSKNGTAIAGRPVSHSTLTGSRWIEFGSVIACFDFVSSDSVVAERDRLGRQWQTSVEISRRLCPSQSPRDLLASVLESVLGISGTSRGFVLLRQADGELQPDISLPSDNETFRGSHTVVTRCLDEHRAVVCSDVCNDVLLGAQASLAGAGVSALACLPLRIGQRAHGVIYVDSAEAGKQFTELDIEILQALADHAALVVGVSQLKDNIVDLTQCLPAELDRKATQDPQLVEKLQSLLPQLGGLDAPVATAMVAGADS